MERAGLRLEVRGVVQGVGFRPFIHRLALRHGLAGRVRNEAGGVRIDVEGDQASLDAFMKALPAEAPPLARIDRIEVMEASAPGRVGFRIARSADDPYRRLPVSPDVATCEACIGELLDPVNRRYRYPFITCTDCGPRYTVIEAMPYDRERTSMRAFDQCAACLTEYTDPSSRRYHSETNSCPDCGPRLWLVSGEPAPAEDGCLDVSDPADARETPDGSMDGHGTAVYRGTERALAEAVRLLLGGRIVALRGLGGFHLACDATDARAVRRLRERKAREAKPLAVMVATPEDARTLGEVDEAVAALLGSQERPIVLLRRRSDAPLAPAVSPGLDTVGVMTAYTPLHRLLLDAVDRPLVMTSGNRSEEPIATGRDEALAQLHGIADAFLLHDREIVSRYDDSVVRVVDRMPVFLRRARGYAPLPLKLPVAALRPLVATGPHLKNTFTLAHGRTAFVSQHIGDLENLETLTYFRRALERYGALFRIRPEVAVRDLHPGYLSTRVAEEMGLGRVIPVQHHHAHVAAVAAEHGIAETVLGVAYDGTGYGDDGRVWGAELLLADLTGYRRIGRLRYAPLPGGDLAVRRPWRTALGYLTLEPGAAAAFARAFGGVPEEELAAARRQAERRINAPEASSMGRLFDAAAAILGVRGKARYEGQAAMELEALAGARPAQPLPFPATRTPDGTWILEPLPLLAALGERAARGEDPADLAAGFHEGVAAGTAQLVREAAADTGTETVALGGGCFQNARLLSSLGDRLERAGLRVLRPRILGPNDGAISYGQAAVAAATLDREVDEAS